MPASSQGSTVSFDGENIGQLLGWTVVPGRAVVQDVSSGDSTYYGDGDEKRLVRQVECLSVEPGRATYTLLGAPPHIKGDIGKKGTLSIGFDGGSLSAEAFLEEFEVTGSVGELIKGSATFILTGDL
jgi:hypothetical protein